MPPLALHSLCVQRRRRAQLWPGLVCVLMQGCAENVAANPLPSHFAVPTSHFRSIGKNGTRPRSVVSETEGNKEGAEEAGG